MRCDKWHGSIIWHTVNHLSAHYCELQENPPPTQRTRPQTGPESGRRNDPCGLGQAV